MYLYVGMPYDEDIAIPYDVYMTTCYVVICYVMLCYIILYTIMLY